MDGLLQDLRFGARMLFRSPGFAAAAILALGLGIGVSTTVFSVLGRRRSAPAALRAARSTRDDLGCEPGEGLGHEPISPVTFLDDRGLSQ
jgi:hypothetical protein